MRWRVGVWSGAGVAAATAVGLGVFWKIKGLEQAGWLAGVLSAFAALVTLAMFLHDRSRSSESQPSAESLPEHESEPTPMGRPVASARTVNTFRDATNVGPVVMGRDISGPVTSGAHPPTEAETIRPSTGRALPTPGDGEGTVVNTFSGGFNQGPVVMGRDISGPVISAPATSDP